MKEDSARIDELEIRVSALLELVEAFSRLEGRTEQVLMLLMEAPGLLERQASSEAANLEAGFKSRDHVQLKDCVLYVNGCPIGLSIRQAILISILIRHALSGDAGFLTTQDIIQEIESGFSSMWSMPLPEDIHETVFRSRKKLGLKRDLLESSVAKGGGLRISTPREHLGPLDSRWIPNPLSN